VRATGGERPRSHDLVLRALRLPAAAAAAAAGLDLDLGALTARPWTRLRAVTRLHSSEALSRLNAVLPLALSRLLARPRIDSAISGGSALGIRWSRLVMRSSYLLCRPGSPGPPTDIPTHCPCAPNPEPRGRCARPHTVVRRPGVDFDARRALYDLGFTDRNDTDRDGLFDKKGGKGLASRSAPTPRRRSVVSVRAALVAASPEFVSRRSRSQSARK
jgi:hypothetical protein